MKTEKKSDAKSISEDVAVVGVKLDFMRYNYDISVKAADLILLTSRQAGLLALAAIASSAIWKDEVSLASGKVWLALLLVSACCSVILHFGITMAHMSLLKCIFDDDQKMPKVLRDQEWHESSTRLSQWCVAIQIITLAVSIVAILLALVF